MDRRDATFIGFVSRIPTRQYQEHPDFRSIDWAKADFVLNGTLLAKNSELSPTLSHTYQAQRPPILVCYSIIITPITPHQSDIRSTDIGGERTRERAREVAWAGGRVSAGGSGHWWDKCAAHWWQWCAVLSQSDGIDKGTWGETRGINLITASEAGN